MTTTVSAAPVGDELFSVDPPSLLAGRCTSCDALHFPRRSMCPVCQSREIAEAELSGRGTLYTFTIVRAAPPNYLGEIPYALGVVELDEGLRVTSTISAKDLDALAIGDAVDFGLIEFRDGDAAITSFTYTRREPAQ